MGSRWGPVVDGVYVTEHPFDGAPASGADGVPMLVAVTSHDPALLMAGSAEFAGLTAERAVDLARANFGEAGVAEADESHPDEPVRLRCARAVDAMTFAATSQTILELAACRSPLAARRSPLAARRSLLAARREAPVCAYEFAQPTDILGGLLGACHSLDLANVFANADRSAFTGTDPARGEVSQSMALAWASFARTGSPQHPGIPDWLACAPDAPVAMRIAHGWQAQPVRQRVGDRAAA